MFCNVKNSCAIFQVRSRPRRESSCPVNCWCCVRPIFWWEIGAKLHQTEQKAGLGQMCYSLYIHHAAERAKQSPATGTQTRSEHTVCAKLHGALQLSRCLSAQNDQVSWLVSQNCFKKDDDADFDTWIVESVGIQSLRLEMRFNLSFQFQVSYQPPQNVKTRQNLGTSRGNVDTRAPLAVSWFSHPWASKLTSGDETSAFDDGQYTHKHAMPGIPKTSPSWMVQFIGIYDIWYIMSIEHFPG